MFDEAGPGVITRIWITTLDKRGTWRFYFDGDDTPGVCMVTGKPSARRVIIARNY